MLALGDVADAGRGARAGVARVGRGRHRRQRDAEAVAAEREHDDAVGSRSRAVDLAGRRAAGDGDVARDRGDRGSERGKVVGAGGEDEDEARVVVAGQRATRCLAARDCCIGMGRATDVCPAAAAGALEPCHGALHVHGHRPDRTGIEVGAGAAPPRRSTI